jgi:hypothetical protein
MRLFDRTANRLRRRLAAAVGLGLLVTWSEIAEQHYYRARFSKRRMYIPVALTPFAAGAALLRSASDGGGTRSLYAGANWTMLLVGVLGTGFHWYGNFTKYRDKEKSRELPGMGATEEDRKHGPPEPTAELAGYNVGALLELGSRGRPWLAPLSLAGLGAVGLLTEQ